MSRGLFTPRTPEEDVQEHSYPTIRNPPPWRLSRVGFRSAASLTLRLDCAVCAGHALLEDIKEKLKLKASHDPARLLNEVSILPQ